MGVREVDEFIALVEGQGDFVGPRDESLIAAAEGTLGVRFPPSYRRFVVALGAGECEGEEFYGVISEDFENSGIPDAVWMTLAGRRDWNLPDSLIVVYFDGATGYFVLDTAKPDDAGEAPVELWEPGVTGPSSDRHVIASDFGTVALRLAQAAAAG